MDLSTTYLGLRLHSPFVVGASPLGDSLETIRELEKCGAAAIVLRSVFEEQITMAREGRIRGMELVEPGFARVLAAYPSAPEYVLSPDAYLEHVRAAKCAVNIPIIASLNGTGASPLLDFAPQLESAGADALEINLYELATSLEVPAQAIESGMCDVVRALRAQVRIPLAVKISPFHTALVHFCGELVRAGASGIVMFNRLMQPDIDLETLKPVMEPSLSISGELLVRLKWAAILYGRVRAPLILTGGVAMPEDGIKAVLAGATAVQMVSAILRDGPSHLIAMRKGLEQWMAARGMTSIVQVRGLASVGHSVDAGALERGRYITMLQQRPGARGHS